MMNGPARKPLRELWATGRFTPRDLKGSGKILVFQAAAFPRFVLADQGRYPGVSQDSRHDRSPRRTTHHIRIAVRRFECGRSR